MNIARNVVAVDFGAESGRLVLCRWNGTEGTLEEVHRFPNAPDQVGNHLVWDMERLWGEIIRGLLKAAAKTGGHIDSVGIDGWGVDYALMDADGERIGHSYCYRDARNVPAMEKVLSKIAGSLHVRCGSRICPCNERYATHYGSADRRTEGTLLLDLGKQIAKACRRA